MGRGKWSGAVGVLLLLAALVLTVHNLREARQAEYFSGETAAKLTEEISRRRTAREAEPEPQSEAPPEAEAESTDYLGLLELPTLSLTLPVAAEWSYPALKRTPCRYSGTAGEVSFVIIAHNYPAISEDCGSWSRGRRSILRIWRGRGRFTLWNGRSGCAPAIPRHCRSRG